MAARIDQAAIVVLAMQFHQSPRNFAQQRDANRLIVDKCHAAAIGLHAAAQDQGFARFDFHIGIGQRIANNRRQRREFERCGNAGLIRASPNQPGIRPIAQHQAQGIQQDRFARPGFARQHAQPRSERQVQRFDEHNVSDGKCGQHSPFV